MKGIEHDIVYSQCDLAQLPSLLALQEVVFSRLDNLALLRRNSEVMMRECLQAPHYAIGAFVQGQLVAIAILYNPIYHSEEALAPYLQSIEGNSYSSANYKLCLVHPDYRGHHLQRVLGSRLETYARGQGVALLCATASPENHASIANLEALGYSLDCSLTKYGHLRNLYYKFLLLH